jgi:hypothetical protein
MQNRIQITIQYGGRYSDSLREGRSGDRIPVGGEIFRTRSDRPWGSPSPRTMGNGSFPRLKRPGRGGEHPPPSSAEVKETVKLHLKPPFGPTWPVLW